MTIYHKRECSVTNGRAKATDIAWRGGCRDVPLAGFLGETTVEIGQDDETTASPTRTTLGRAATASSGTSTEGETATSAESTAESTEEPAETTEPETEPPGDDAETEAGEQTETEEPTETPEPAVDGAIVVFEPEEGTFSPEDSQTADVTVENTGNARHTF